MKGFALAAVILDEIARDSGLTVSLIQGMGRERTLLAAKKLARYRLLSETDLSCKEVATLTGATKIYRAKVLRQVS